MKPMEVLDFWLGPLDEDGLAAPAARKRWFAKDDAFDQSIRDGFGAIYDTLAAGSAPDDWTESEPDLVARVIVLDQFPRNMFRGSGRMYASDELALSLATALTPKLTSLPAAHAVFAVMPFMHGETLAAQEEGVRLFEMLSATESFTPAARDAFKGNLKFANSHRDVVKRFGRFPHRNALLDRSNTPEEETYLQDPKAGW